MRIGSNNNYFAQRQLRETGVAMSRALERLASGQRISRASDDPAGLAVASGLTSQVRSLAKISESLSQTQGWLNTADGAIGIQRDILQRMRELALQAANGSYSIAERETMQVELSELLSEFNRVTASTEFNGMSLLSGGDPRSIQVGTEKGQSIEFEMPDLQANKVFVEEEQVDILAHELEFQGMAGPTGVVGLVTTGDLNANGLTDMVIRTTQGASVRMNDGDGNFTNVGDIDFNFGSGESIRDIYSMELTDYDGNGNLDLITYAQTRSYNLATGYINRLMVFVNRGNGDGTFQTAERKQLAFRQNGGGYNDFLGGRMRVGDLNGDGTKDIVIEERNTDYGTPSSGLRIYSGTNNPSLFSEPSISMFGDSFVTGAFGDFILADLRGDGLDSLVLGTNGDTLVRHGLADGAVSGTTLNVGGFRATRLGAYDLNGDGKKTIVSTSNFSTTLRIHGEPAGSAPALQESINLGYTGQYFQMADLNGDGVLEVIVTGNADQAEVYNRKGGVYQLAGSATVGSTNQQVLVGRFNDDEYLDFMVRPNNNQLSIQLTQTPEIVATYTDTTSAVHKVSVVTQENAQELLGILDIAIRKTLEAGSQLGALQNRLDISLSVLQGSQENLLSARSQILDADFAEETAEVTAMAVLQQAQVAVLSQASFSLQAVLALLVNR